MFTPRHTASSVGTLLAGGAGVYCAATLIGLYRVVTGVVVNDGDWVAGVPGLMCLGGLAGWVLARRHPEWLRRVRARRMLFAAWGMLSLPLAGAIGVGAALSTTAAALLVLCGAAGMVCYCTGCVERQPREEPTPTQQDTPHPR